ncbi:hypothetical protein MA16_Dca014620 [Dendrobium catenatum]|uniref:Uncharacterized protein n=1 Tax=Dendrobium catenatum TaxID=906689 RepID=A0A2I0WYP4_9ASPA|nr:hypothetical protein MA16_Dca014620 [Dendrobium catenatum]
MMSKLRGQSFPAKVSHEGRRAKVKTASKLFLWSAKLFRRFRDALVSSLPTIKPPVTHQFVEDRSDVPERSSTLNISPRNSHYDEAIADCIEFLNKSCQDGR